MLWGWGRGWGFLFHFILSKTAKLEKINGKPRPIPLSLKSKMRKLRFFALRAASSLIWGDGGLLFHFIVSKITDETTCHANFKIHERNPIVLPFKRNLFG